MLNSPLADLADLANRDPDRRLLLDGESSLTYGQVHREALGIGTFLRSFGIERGDRVGILMGKSHRQALAQLGALAAEAVMVPISDLLKPDQAQHIIDDCGVKAVIVDANKIDRLGSYADSAKIIPVSSDGFAILDGIRKIGLVERAPEIIGQDTAAIIYTSGSTGMPKGIVVSHRNLWDGARIVSSYLGLSSDDRLAQVLSLNFDYGLNQLFCAIHVGAELHFTTFHFPKDLFSFLETHNITTLALMPVFLSRLFDARFFQPSFAENISTLKRITTSGGRVPTHVTATIRATFPNTDLYLMYGLTEAFRSTFLPPDQVDKRPNSIGTAIPDVRIMVLDENGHECAADQPGELVHRGGVITKGYWNAPEETVKRYRSMEDSSGNSEMVIYSGDLVKRDSEGYLYFISRLDKMIKTSGHRVSPEEIERVAETIGAIDHAVVFGVEHEVLGEEIVLVCILKEEHAPPDEVEIKSYLRQKLAAYMIPHKILFQQDYEVTAGNQGKIDHASVREIAMKSLSVE